MLIIVSVRRLVLVRLEWALGDKGLFSLELVDLQTKGPYGPWLEL